MLSRDLTRYVPPSTFDEVVGVENEQVDIEIPGYMSKKQSLGRKFNTMELPLQLSAVRLVIKMGDQDVVVRHLRGGAPHEEQKQHSNLPRHTRYIAGTDTAISWPEDEIIEHEAQPNDTKLGDFTRETYIMDVDTPPIPEGVQDELIRKQRRGRMVHEESYLARKIIEDARSDWYTSRKATAGSRQEHSTRKREEANREAREWYDERTQGKSFEKTRDWQGKHGVKKEQIWRSVLEEMAKAKIQQARP